jgi:hypothetical protein
MGAIPGKRYPRFRVKPTPFAHEGSFPSGRWQQCGGSHSPPLHSLLPCWTFPRGPPSGTERRMQETLVAILTSIIGAAIALYAKYTFF